MSISNSKGVNKKNSSGINGSDGINLSNGIDWSDGINRSNGINLSNGINRSNSINGSYGINWSNGINGSDGINESDGINGSNGINWSDGINRSYGISRSYGILNSYGVDKAIFLADKEHTASIFGVDVSNERYDEVWGELHRKLDGWYPKFNNAFELYTQAGNEWKKVKASDITNTLSDWEQPYEAWKDMPKEAVEYVKSLPEFNAEMFKRITGIDVNEEDEVDVTVEGKTTRISRKSAIDLGLLKD